MATQQTKENGLNSKVVQALCRHPILNRKEERALLEDYLLYGDWEARNTLVLCHQRSIINLIKRHFPKSVFHQVAMEDLVQVGNLVLMKTIDKFDLRRETRLMSYARKWVRRALQRQSFKDLYPVAVHERAAQIYLKHERVRARKTLQFGISDSDEETSYKDMAVQRGITTPVDLCEAPVFFLSTLSNEAPSAEQEIVEKLYQKRICDRFRVFQESFSDSRYAALLERRLLQEDPKDAETLEEIGKTFDLSRERIRQIEEKLIKKLRIAFKDLR